MSDIFPKLTLVTGSAAKLEEVRRITGREIDQLAVDLPEVQAVDVHEVVSAKALAAFRAAGSAHPVLVEDTGLFIEAWNGLPGALIRWFEESVGPVGICKMLDGFTDRQATAQTVLGLFDGRLRTYSGQVTGALASRPRGEGGFGFDSIFIPDGSTLTFAEMGPKAKDRYSMRRIALDQLMTDLGNDAAATEVGVQMEHDWADLRFLTSSNEKYAEYCRLFGMQLKRGVERQVERQYVDLERLIFDKVEELKDSQTWPFFVEHAGLAIKGWNWLPGGITAPIMDKVGCEGICRMLHLFHDDERRARAIVVIGYCDPGGHTEVFSGTRKGTIVRELRGANGFGWDPIFMPEGHQRTYAEMTMDEKNEISPRGSAQRQFYEAIESTFAP